MKKISVKKAVMLAILYTVVAAIAVSTTVAYLTGRDAKVNVFTFGQVKIEQIELQRIKNARALSEYGLEEFTDGKELYPAVYDSIRWAAEPQKWPTGGSSTLFSDDIQNVIDKFVFVENTGKNDAYVRTWFAFEAGSLSFERFDELMHVNINDTHWTWSDWNETPVNIDGVDYYVICATYTGTDTVHTGGILPVGETTRPSLLQLFFDNAADMAEIEMMGDDYKVIAASQAVQTAGFKDVESAFAASFGDAHPFTK